MFFDPVPTVRYGQYKFYSDQGILHSTNNKMNYEGRKKGIQKAYFQVALHTKLAMLDLQRYP